MLPRGAMLLDVGGYLVDLSTVLAASSPPLFSWMKYNMAPTLTWGLPDKCVPGYGFWVAEFSFFMNGCYHHYIPGVQVAYMHGQRRIVVGKKTLIWQKQQDIQIYFEDCLPRDGVIYYKGGTIERNLAQLLGVRCIDIASRGVAKVQPEHVQKYQQLGFCYVHTKSVKHCPKAEVLHFMDSVTSWSRPDDMVQ